MHCSFLNLNIAIGIFLYYYCKCGQYHRARHSRMPFHYHLEILFKRFVLESAKFYILCLLLSYIYLVFNIFPLFITESLFHKQYAQMAMYLQRKLQYNYNWFQPIMNELTKLILRIKILHRVTVQNARGTVKGRSHESNFG